MRNAGGRALALTLALACPALAAGPRPTTVKLGSLAPEGTPWHRVLLKIGGSWQDLSGGRVKLRIYPGGVLGDEPEMIKKLRIGQLHAVGVTTVGLSHLDEGILALQAPLMFDSYAELDHVRSEMEPLLERRLLEKGYRVLLWTDGGWIRFFTKERVSSVDDLRKQKLFVWSGDSNSARWYTSAGFDPVPLAVTDMLPALQTGLISVFDCPPLAALANQWFAVAPNMINLRWAPLIGAIVVSERKWNRVDGELRPRLLEAAKEAGDAYRKEIRELSEAAVPEMEKHGLTVVELTAAERAEWEREVGKMYPAFRKDMGGPVLFDKVLELRNEYRASNK